MQVYYRCRHTHTCTNEVCVCTMSFTQSCSSSYHVQNVKSITDADTHTHMHKWSLCTCMYHEFHTKLFILLSCAGQFPSADGLIAPGMHCTYTVTFSPDSLANYQDELRVPVCFVYCNVSSRFYLAMFPGLSTIEVMIV